MMARCARLLHPLRPLLQRKATDAAHNRAIAGVGLLRRTGRGVFDTL
jgi:hypothetical protein